VATLTASVTAGNSGGAPYCLVRLSGEADVTGTETLRGLLAAETARKPRLLVIDLSGLHFMDSAALHAILRVGRDLNRDGDVLALAAPRDPARALSLSGADQLVAVHPSVRAAAGTAGHARRDEPGPPAHGG
jgi:anti-sigma B factor antagonist